MTDIRENLRQYTKDELIDYIASVSFLLQRHPPEETILELRLKKIYDEIDNNLEKTCTLLEEAKNKQISALSFNIQYATLSAESDRLNERCKKAENRWSSLMERSV